MVGREVVNGTLVQHFQQEAGLGLQQPSLWILFCTLKQGTAAASFPA